MYNLDEHAESNSVSGVLGRLAAESAEEVLIATIFTLSRDTDLDVSIAVVCIEFCDVKNRNRP